MTFLFIQRFFFNEIFFNEFVYNNFFWLNYANLINTLLVLFIVLILGIVFLKDTVHVKILNFLSAYFLSIFLLFSCLEYNYIFFNLNFTYNQNITFFFNFFLILTTITTIIFFLGICNSYFSEENTKVEFSLLIWCIYIAANFLIASTDFIAIIILFECIAFSSYILVGFERQNKFSITSALKYLILASVPSIFFILSIILFYNIFGNLSQNYIVILLQTIVEQNYFNLSIIDQTFFNVWKFINNIYFIELLNFNFLLNYTFLHFLDYFKTLDEFLFYFNPGFLIDLLYLEKFLITPSLQNFSDVQLPIAIDGTLVKNALNVTSTDFINLHVQYTLQYKLIFKELLFFKHCWNFFFNEQNFFFLPSTWNCAILFKNLLTFEFLQNNELWNILAWFRVLSLAEYMRILYECRETTLTPQLIFDFLGVTKFQILNAGNFLVSCLQFKEFANLTLRGYTDMLYTYNEFFLEKQNFLLETLKINFFNDFLKKNLIQILNPANVFNQLLHNIFLLNTTPLFYEAGISNSNYLFKLEWILGSGEFLYWDEIWENFFFSYFNETSFYQFEYFDIFFPFYLIIIFLLINLAFKLTAAPFHFWAPAIYGGTPLASLTFLSIFSKLTIIFFMFGLFLNVFNILSTIWQPLLLIIAFLSVIISILGAFSEKLFKKFYIYSSIGHVGFLLIGFTTLSKNGIYGTLNYLIIYIISSLIIWFIILHLTKKTMTLVNLKGLSFNQSLLSFIFIITIFSLSGIPPLGGFFVKYEIFYSVINSSFFFEGFILLLLTVISFFYYLRLIKIIYFENSGQIIKNKNLIDIKIKLIIFLYLYLIFYFIIDIELTNNCCLIGLKNAFKIF